MCIYISHYILSMVTCVSGVQLKNMLQTEKKVKSAQVLVASQGPSTLFWENL